MKTRATAPAAAMVTLVTLVTAGCGYSIKTATDYNRGVRFSDYNTFFMMKGNPSDNPLMDQRIAADVRAALLSKGWLEVPAADARAAVVVHAATKTKHSYETFYDGWSGWRYRWGGIGSSTTFVDDYKVGTIVIDIFDASTKEAIWRGSATDALSNNSKDNAKTTDEAITRLFSRFPPAT